jgi:hypothetical protein
MMVRFRRTKDLRVCGDGHERGEIEGKRDDDGGMKERGIEE